MVAHNFNIDNFEEIIRPHTCTIAEAIADNKVIIFSKLKKMHSFRHCLDQAGGGGGGVRMHFSEKRSFRPFLEVDLADP